MTTTELLLQKYGPLLTIAQVAALLDRTPDGLRVTLYSKNKISDRLLSSRVKIGRRVYFRAVGVGSFLDACE